VLFGLNEGLISNNYVFSLHWLGWLNLSVASSTRAVVLGFGGLREILCQRD
jgi:hypothetical protein